MDTPMTDMSAPVTPDLLAERGDFYLTLARCFLTPQTEEQFRAFVDYLGDDLAEFDASLGYGFGPELEDLRAALSKLPTHDRLLVEYSRLFLQPPRLATLNVCQALDGALNGGTVSEMELFYRKHGVERGDHFRDLSDHVSVQLEFVAYLCERAAAGVEAGAEKAARHFLHRFVSRWIPHFEAAIERAGKQLELVNPYLPLARILAVATAHDAAANPDWVKPRKRVEAAIEKARRDHAASGITSEALADIKRKLTEKGLSTDHLDVALDRRNEALGLTAKTPPDPRR